MLPLDAKQCQKRDDAAFAIVVDTHGEADVFDARDDEECPQDQRQRAHNRRGIRMRAGEIEHRLERVERARADVAEYHSQRA